MSDSVRRMGEVSREYETKANESEGIYTAAARAESAYKHEKAKRVIRFKESEKMSVAEAETRADADDAIAELYQTRLVAQAVADAHKAKLAQLREQVAVGRTAVVDERAADQFHSRGYGGAA
jgi:hypothetical protein